MQVLLHMREASVSAVMSEDRVLPQVSHLAQTASLMTLALSCSCAPLSVPLSHCHAGKLPRPLQTGAAHFHTQSPEVKIAHYAA